MQLQVGWPLVTSGYLVLLAALGFNVTLLVFVTFYLLVVLAEFYYQHNMYLLGVYVTLELKKIVWGM